MKRVLTIALALVLAASFTLTTANAAEKREKFGVDKRSDVAKRVTFKPSTEKIRWKMVMPWSKGLLF
ncbi:MAG: TRAP transporter substrate-binding protein DctP, partial [Pseudomonadota bacterium]